MTNDDYGPGLLAPYRVLDLTDGRGLLCGKMLGDLGADVVQVEPPGGSPSRRVGPFYKDERAQNAACSGGPTAPTSAASRWTLLGTTGLRYSAAWSPTPTF